MSKHKINWSAQRKRSHDTYMAKRNAEFKRVWGKPLYATDYFDHKGRRIDMWRWAKLSYETLPDGRRKVSRFKRVAQTTTASGAHWISTVWLGMNHNMWGSGPPIIFESMVFCHHDDAEAKSQRNAQRVLGFRDPSKIAEFGEEYEPNDCPIDNDMDRYATKRDALKGHWRMVEAVRKFEKTGECRYE